MVQLVEVEDEHFQDRQAGPEEDEGDYTDTDSEISNDSDYDPRHETLAQRLWALRDMVPPPARARVGAALGAARRALGAALLLAGRATWSVSVSALLLGVPFALCWAEEQQLLAMEQEMRQREQGQDLLTAGAGGDGGGGGGGGAGGARATADMLGAAALEKNGAVAVARAKPAL